MATCHLFTGINATRRSTRADGTRLLVVFRTVRHGASAKVMALLVARKPFTNADAADVNELARFEIIGSDGLSKLKA